MFPTPLSREYAGVLGEVAPGYKGQHSSFGDAHDPGKFTT